MTKKSKIVIWALSLCALLIIAAVGFYKVQTSPRSDNPLVYANRDMLVELWADYKRNYIEPGSGRTLDKQQNNITTSEGQSYTMLRAVWMDDQATFDQSWKWTKDNLQRDDSLMSWKFGPTDNGNYGIQTAVGGQNTATDGDSDIALALLMAYSRWKDDDYLYDARPIINSMWEREVVMVNGKPVLAANDLERNNPVSIIVNPSYFAPYAYRVFDQIDKNDDHNWSALTDNSYNILKQVNDAKLDVKTSSGLTPDWVVMNRETGRFSAPEASNLKTVYSFDALRTPWRLALDYAWHKDPRDRQLLEDYRSLSADWKRSEKLAAVYSHDGRALVNYETPAMYGGAIGYFKVLDKSAGDDIYRTKLKTLYSPDEQKSATNLSYYDANWTWFGIALYNDRLPNLTEK